MAGEGVKMSSKKPKDYKQLGRDIAEKQAKRGRPLKGAAPLNASISVRMTERERDNLLTWCWRYEESPSDVVREALRVLSISGL